MKKKIQMSFSPEVHKVLKEDAEALGLTMVGYASMLIMKARTEKQAINFIANMSPEQLQRAIEDHTNKAGQDQEKCTTV